LGKAWLVSRLQALLQGGRLHLPRTAAAEALGRELMDYEIRIDANANDTYGAFKLGSHDDLVTALGLCCQEDAPPVVSPVGLAQASAWNINGGGMRPPASPRPW
jgi:hypothetical protein